MGFFVLPLLSGQGAGKAIFTALAAKFISLMTSPRMVGERDPRSRHPPLSVFGHWVKFRYSSTQAGMRRLHTGGYHGNSVVNSHSCTPTPPSLPSNPKCIAPWHLPTTARLMWIRVRKTLATVLGYFSNFFPLVKRGRMNLGVARVTTLRFITFTFNTLISSPADNSMFEFVSESVHIGSRSLIPLSA